MSIFKRTKTATIEPEKLIAPITASSSIIGVNPAPVELTPIATSEPEPEEWIWVEGYKGTDMNMKCRDFQYELGTQYDMPESQAIEECKSGFHLCLNLMHVFAYYNIGNGNRFFKVKALVRKSDKEKYCKHEPIASYYGQLLYSSSAKDKLAAKSIIFISECTLDEILEGTDVSKLSEQYKLMAINSSVDNAMNAYRVSMLVEDGYSEAFALYIVNVGKFEVAHALSSQKDLSMDVKVLTMFFRT